MFEFLFPLIDSLKESIISKSYYDFCKNCVYQNFDEKYINDLIKNNIKFKKKDDSLERFQKFKEDMSLVWRLSPEVIQNQDLYKNFKFEIEKYNQTKQIARIEIDFSKNLYDNAIISSHEAHLKKFPTDEIWFEYDEKKYKDDKFLMKFDLNQESGLKFGKPIKILNFTKEKDWALVLTSDETIGFTKSSNFTKEKDWALVLTSDETIGFTKSSNFSYVSKDDEKAFLENEFRNRPLDFNENSLRSFFQIYLGADYAWGDRDWKGFDCSSILKDYFELFGFHMKRNSFSQINDEEKFEKIIILEGLNSVDKKKFIIQNAKPFKSVLYMKGHIMLYLGEDPEKKGEIIVFHAISSINAKKKNEKEIYKFFLSKAVIGNLPDEKFFEKNQDFKPLAKLLIDRIEAIGNLRGLD